ncbi:MAG: CsbD family protein [Ilumatobacteraceae bacterium]
MSDAKKDDLVGRGKEALGSLTDDDDLREEGRDDQRAAKVKDGIERAGDKAKDAVDKVRDKMRD